MWNLDWDPQPYTWICIRTTAVWGKLLEKCNGFHKLLIETYSIYQLQQHIKWLTSLITLLSSSKHYLKPIINHGCHKCNMETASGGNTVPSHDGCSVTHYYGLHCFSFKTRPPLPLIGLRLFFVFEASTALLSMYSELNTSITFFFFPSIEEGGGGMKFN